VTHKRAESKSSRTLSRRDFIRNSALGAVGLSLGSRLTGKAGGAFLAPSPVGKSRVVLVRHKAVIDETGQVNQPLLQKMLDKGITSFTGRNSLEDAWGQFISPNDVVGLKVNTLGLMNFQGTDLIQHFPGMVNAIVAGLRKTGVKDGNIIVWDRSGEELSQAGFTIQKEPGSMRILANKQNRRDREGDYSPKTYPVGSSSSRVSRILSDECTAMINVAVPKSHRLSGFTCSLKNHYGTIDNPSKYHTNKCTGPGIAEVNTISMIRSKQKLVICDALLVVTEGGPRWSRRFTKPYGGILVGTDPVAVDTVALRILDERRAADGMETIADGVLHLPLAAKLGVGTNDFSRIELIKHDLG